MPPLIAKIALTYVIFHAFQPDYHPPLIGQDQSARSLRISSFVFSGVIKAFVSKALYPTALWCAQCNKRNLSCSLSCTPSQSISILISMLCNTCVLKIESTNQWPPSPAWGVPMSEVSGGNEVETRDGEESNVLTSDDPIFMSPSYFLRWPHHHVTVLIWEKGNRPGQRTQVSPLHCLARARNMINRVDFKKQTSTTFGNFLQHMATVGSL